MNSTATLQSYLSTLTPTQSARTIRQAVQHQATILLKPEEWIEAGEIVARISSGEEETLTAVLIDSLPLAAPDRLKGQMCNAQILLSEQTYLFKTNVSEVRQDGQVVSLVLTPPVRIQAETRRRFPRLRFADSSKVHLLWRDGEEMHDDTGTLCNVSGDGAAVLIDRRAAEELEAADTVFVEFSLPRCPEQFHLPGYVKGITPGGEHDRALLSLNFQDDPSKEVQAQLAVLKAYLNQHLGQPVKKEAKK